MAEFKSSEKSTSSIESITLKDSKKARQKRWETVEKERKANPLTHLTLLSKEGETPPDVSLRDRKVQKSFYALIQSKVLQLKQARF